MKTGKVHIMRERGIRDTLSRFFHWLRKAEEKMEKGEIDGKTFEINASPAFFVRNHNLRNVDPTIIHESDIDEFWHSFRIVFEIANRLLKSIAGGIRGYIF